MSYTIGIKKKWWFGYRKLRVKGHDWQNLRFIINLEDGSQEHLPGFSVPHLKVYSDFWTHLAQIKAEQVAKAEQPVMMVQPVRAVPRETVEQEDIKPEPQSLEIVHEETPQMMEAKRRATLRIGEISAGIGPN